MEKRKPRNYTDEFKKQMVELYLHGKRRCDIIREYELTPSAFNRWVNYYKTSGSFQTKENRTPKEQELIDLRKKVKQLEMEVDVLKHAALIMGRE
jgi:transposase